MQLSYYDIFVFHERVKFRQRGGKVPVGVTEASVKIDFLSIIVCGSNSFFLVDSSIDPDKESKMNVPISASLRLVWVIYFIYLLL